MSSRTKGQGDDRITREKDSDLQWDGAGNYKRVETGRQRRVQSQ